MKTIRLNAVASIPVFGLGTWQLSGEECIHAVETALGLGYRHIDTADAYSNHREVAEGIKRSGIAREGLFITTKVWNTEHARANTIASGKRFLEELGLEYIDLLLIHWPMREVPVQETLGAMNELRKTGLVKALGVSNFTPHHITDALEASIEITNNQVELHPLFNQKELRVFCAKHSISITAYSPLGRGNDLKHPLLKELAEKHHVSSAQVALNWIVSRGMIAIPKSAHSERIKENFESLNFSMREEDLQRIDTMPQDARMIHPEFADFDY